MRRLRSALALVAASGLALGAAAARADTAAQAAADEVTTAAAHAAYAAGGSDTNAVHLHLHHVINCLVGPDGDDYDASAGDPCHGQGHGALRDAETAALGPAVRTRLDFAKELASVGVALQDLEPDRDVAKAVEALLRVAHDRMGTGAAAR